MNQPRYKIEWNDACLLGDTTATNTVRDTLTGKVVWEGQGQGNTIMAEQEFSWGVRTSSGEYVDEFLQELIDDV